VADRPDRFEPRAKKRRRDHFAWLTEPRQKLKRKMAKGFTKIGSSGFPVGKFVRINTYVDRFALEIHWVSSIGGGYRSSPPQ
jgi:hypothetical protein